MIREQAQCYVMRTLSLLFHLMLISCHKTLKSSMAGYFVLLQMKNCITFRRYETVQLKGCRNITQELKNQKRY